MKISTENSAEKEVKITFEAESIDTEKALDRAYQRIVKRVEVPGFRKGKAPRSIIESTYGQAALMEEAINIIVPESVDKAIRENNIDAIVNDHIAPQVEVTSREPLKWVVTVPLRPSVDIGDYKSIRVPLESPEITDEQVNGVMENLRYQTTPWEPADRAAQMGDLLTIDVLGLEGKQTALNQKDLQFSPTPDQKMPVPGFSDHLVGMTKGETKEFVVTVAADDANTGIAGKTFNFKVTLKEVKEKKLPEINDEWVKNSVEGIENLDKLKEKIKEDIKEEADSIAKAEQQEKAVKEVIKQAKIQYPTVLIEHELEHMLINQEQVLAQQSLTLDAYLQSANKTQDQLKDEMRPVALDRVMRALVLSKIQQEEKLAVTQSDIDAEIAASVAAQGSDPAAANQMRQLLTKPENLDSIERIIANRKSIQRIGAIARGEN